MKRLLVLAVTHGAALAVGFALGIYLLPILTAPAAPSASEVATAASQAAFKGVFRRDLKDSDFVHWGEGTVSVSRDAIALMGKIARVGDVRTLENFIVPVPPGIDPAAYNTVIVWCESCGQFITAARYP